MTPINRSDENHQPTALRHPLRRCILRAAADVEERRPMGPGLWLGKAMAAGPGRVPATPLLETGGAMQTTEESKTTWAEDEDFESAVLRQLLDLHPIRLTLEELTREFGARRSEFAERDAVERAVRDLAAAGLLHQGEEFVVPTRAALRFNELLDR
jgi:hypothetical protein